MTTSETKTQDVYSAIVQVMQAVPYVKKTSSKQLGYSYASEAELIRLLHPAMAEVGLSMVPENVELLVTESYRTADKEWNGQKKPGAEMRRIIIKVRYVLRHAPSGTQQVIEAIGEASDSSDKATSKAMTMALKYALRQVFLIETGDEDPDARRPSSNGAHREQWYQGILAKMDEVDDPQKLREWKARAANPSSGFSKSQYEELSAKIDKKLSAVNKSKQPA